ncbi:MAG TPA: histidine kinase [Chryseosolibacter sp.]
MTAERYTPLQKYGWKVFILYIFSVLFKSFDQSFSHDFFAFALRGQIFSVIWIVYGLLAWWLGKIIVNTIERRLHTTVLPVRVVILGMVLLLYGFPVALLFSYVYRMMDVVLFDRSHLWTDIGLTDYALNAGLLILYTLILTINGLNYYYKNAVRLELHAERLMKENLQARYDALRQQIEPHFFFNSLSVLTNLVYRDADLSAQYITQLAKLYRYILERKIENMVPLAAELEFLKSYMFLMNIRHQEEIQFSMHLSDETLERCFIPPATLQILVENAIKHNRFSKNSPLRINLAEVDGMLVVTNNLNRRDTSATSLGLGLENVKKRYELLGENKMSIDTSGDRFEVKIPKLFHLKS